MSIVSEYLLHVTLPEVSRGPRSHLEMLMMKRFAIGTLVGVGLTLFASVAAAQSCSQSINISNFNGTPIQPGSFVWFNANFSASGVPSTGASIYFSSSTITFTDSIGQPYTLNVPNGRVVFDPTVQFAITTFDSSKGWTTTVPLAGSDEIFFSGVVFQIPATFSGLVHGPVTWQGSFAADNSGITVDWKWGAAVYSIFSMDYNALGVKPTHKLALNYNNSDHAGTPEGLDPSSGVPFKAFVEGGARGGGGSNWTGSWSGTARVSPCLYVPPPPAGPPPA
jgi:hypothetical protein